MLKNLRNILLVGLFLSGCEKKKANFIIVGEGETLEIICEKYNISKKHLITSNELKAPYALCSGQALKYYTVERKTKILSVKKSPEPVVCENKVDLFSLESLKVDPQTDTNDILNDSIQEELAKEEQLDMQNIKDSHKHQKEQKEQIKKQEAMDKKLEKDIKAKEAKPEVIKTVKLDILFPIKNGVIDKSMPFSQKHGKRQDGVYILNAGDVLAPCDGQIVFVDNANRSVYVKRNINNASWIITYSSLSSINVLQGDHVKKGDKLAKSSGSIFMRIWNGKEYVDPATILNS